MEGHFRAILRSYFNIICQSRGVTYSSMEFSTPRDAPEQVLEIPVMLAKLSELRKETSLNVMIEMCKSYANDELSVDRTVAVYRDTINSLLRLRGVFNFADFVVVSGFSVAYCVYLCDIGKHDCVENVFSEAERMMTEIFRTWIVRNGGWEWLLAEGYDRIRKLEEEARALRMNILYGGLCVGVVILFYVALFMSVKRGLQR